MFVFDGDNTSTGYGGNGYTMNAGERLIGEHEGLTVDPDQGARHSPAPGQPGRAPDPDRHRRGRDRPRRRQRGPRPEHRPERRRGRHRRRTGDVSGTIDDVNILDTGTVGTQPGLELDGTTGTFAVSNLTVSTNGATGVRLNNAGTVTFAPAGNISITTTGAAGLVATGGHRRNLGTSAFDTITVTGSTTGGVSMANATGTHHVR